MHISLLLLLFLVSVSTVRSIPNLIPYPNNITYGTSELAFSPCSVVFHFKPFLDLPVKPIPSYYFEMLDFYYQAAFPKANCHYKVKEQAIYRSLGLVEYYEMVITVRNYEQDKPSYPSSTTDESYFLNLDWGDWTMKTENYFGFLRGLETFVQMFEDLPDAPFYKLNNIPATIQDAPALGYRGIMLDCARHFLHLSTLKHVLDGMMFHKLNVFHWHLTDEESFPMQLQSLPIITQYGAYSSKEVYSKEDISEIVEYARMRGIRVIPEADSPAHSLSWGFSPEYSDIALKCFLWADYNGQLDPTLQKTYDVVHSILDDLNEYFPDDYVHLGGDEVSFSCWESKDWIKAFMEANNLTNGVALQQYYKDRETSMLNSRHSAMFWVNDANFKYRDSDILEYWASKNDYGLIQNYSNKVVFSNYDFFYLDLGYGNVFGDQSWAPFVPWKKIYSFNPLPPEIEKSRILGAECPLWAELNSDYTTDNHLWSRGSVFAERMWNPQINSPLDNKGIRDVATRIYANEKRLITRGFAPSPITSEYCSLHLEVCFPDA